MKDSSALGTAVVFTRSVTPPVPNRDVTVTANPAVVDTIQISAGSQVTAILVDLRYVPAPPAYATVTSSPAFTVAGTAQTPTPILPGQGWELIPDLTSLKFNQPGGSPWKVPIAGGDSVSEYAGVIPVNGSKII